MPRLLWGIVLAGVLASEAPARIIQYEAPLDGRSEVPALHVAGHGRISAKLDTRTRTLRYRLVFADLSGPAVGAHLHGPALPGVIAGHVVMMGMGMVKSPVAGSTVLTSSQMAALRSGRWYANVHTKAHPDGEIRGQLVPAR